jgi:hypothetical protein
MSENLTPTSTVPTAEQEAAAAAEISTEQETELMAEAKRELGLVVKALRTGNRESAVAQYLAGLHGLRFVNLCRKAGKARSFATGELERDLSWWLGKSVDANLILRTYASITALHGDLEPPTGKDKDSRKAWAERVDSLPPIGHFHKAYSQLVERVEADGVEAWVLLVGYEDKCRELYANVQAKGLKLEDTRESGAVTEKGILTLTREFMTEFLRYKSGVRAAEAAVKRQEAESLEGAAKVVEDKTTQQQAVVKELLGKAAAEQDPEAKAKAEAEAKAADKVLQDYRKDMRALVDAAAAKAKEARAAQTEADTTERKAEKQDARLTRKADDEAARELPWQARGEQAAEKATVKDLADALFGIVAKHEEPEDVLYALLQAHKAAGDSSKQFQAALAAFGVTWTRKQEAVAAA